MRSWSCVVAVVSVLLGFTAQAARAPRGHALSLESLTPQARLDILKRAQVWAPTHVSSMDIKAGPQSPAPFAREKLVSCSYVPKRLNGASPKFLCDVGDGDEVKVKYGADDGEVYAEVAATRLLWALGFGADHMYPVRVLCHGCPRSMDGGRRLPSGDTIFDVAAVERKMPGREVSSHKNQGWSWPELDLVDERAGGAPQAQRDALKLLATLLQHTDNKPEQQRLACLDDEADDGEGCRHPFMLVHDVGQTFGRANLFNLEPLGSVNFERWSRTPVWKDVTGCVAEMPKALKGNLRDPRISEAGRAFLAGLLVQLTDDQIRDLFEVARFDLRPRAPQKAGSPPAAIENWILAFKAKRDAVVDRRCDS